MKTLDEFLDEIERIVDMHKQVIQRSFIEDYFEAMYKIILEMRDKISYYAKMDGLASEQSAIACLNNISKILNEGDGE
ncbi:MAG: hypothetical protein AB7O96_00990 [Pseudobdellovibrionaceae bacterium]